MPELPEVEVLVRHLAPLLAGKMIHRIEVRRARVLRPTPERQFARVLTGAKFTALSRRGKYLLFQLRSPRRKTAIDLLGHLGMTGRMYLRPAGETPPRHAAVIFHLGAQDFVYEDTRYFGRLTLDTGALAQLGPEPLGAEFSPESLTAGLRRSAQPVKVKLLDQSLVAGVGNIYASEALFRAGVSPGLPARKTTAAQAARLWQAMREVLAEAIDCGSTLPLDWSGNGRRDGLFYYGQAAGAPDFYEERLRVYDRAGQPCAGCGAAIRRIVQAARSTFYCPRCQRA